MTAVLDAVGRIDQRWLLVALLLVLDLWAATLVVLSRVGRREKVLWCGVIFLCPIVGCLFWFVLGPKAERPGPAGS